MRVTTALAHFKVTSEEWTNAWNAYKDEVEQEGVIELLLKHSFDEGRPTDRNKYALVQEVLLLTTNFMTTVTEAVEEVVEAVLEEVVEAVPEEVAEVEAVEVVPTVETAEAVEAVTVEAAAPETATAEVAAL